MIERLCLTLGLAMMAAPALADLDIEFIEGAPKDRFVISNSSSCRLARPELTIDLKTASAGLVFDVAENGAGLEVFQPFDVIEGAYHLAERPIVQDGATAITLKFRALPAWQQVTFTIDMDDTDSTRGITVSPQELRGASVTLHADSGLHFGAFDDFARARVLIPGC